MFYVSDIFHEAKTVFGYCLEPKLMEWISDAIELLSNKGEIDPLVAFVDLCVWGGCITTPREVETILAANICGHPALGKDVLFDFHINGPGSHGGSGGCNLEWADVGNFPTYRDISCPSKLIAFLDSPEDAGKEVRVFGFDEQNRPLRSQEGNVWRDGVLVPTIFGYALPDANAQVVSRITEVKKDRTVANIRLSSFDNSTGTGTLLGIYEPDEVYPLYRRFKISRRGSGCGSTWVRICFRKRTARVYSIHDRIYLHSRMALILAMRALKSYSDYDIPNGNAFEANATRLLTEKESVLTGVGIAPIQVLDRNNVSDKHDYLD